MRILLFIFIIFCSNAFASERIVLQDDKDIPLGTINNPLHVTCLNGACGSGSSQWTGTNPIYFNGNVGINASNPATALEIDNGALYLNTAPSQIFMKSPNGSCFVMTVDNGGLLNVTPTGCPTAIVPGGSVTYLGTPVTSLGLTVTYLGL